MKPRLLDLFCGAGGAAMGYHRAGFEVVGMDINPQPNYPFPFICADVPSSMMRMVLGGSRQDEKGRFWHLDDFDAFHASPPCQRYSYGSAKDRNKGKQYPDLVAPTRAHLIATGKPYIMENVVGAPLISPIRLCGVMFDLRVIRHRLFESNVGLVEPHHIRHQPPRQVNGRIKKKSYYMQVAGHGGQSYSFKYNDWCEAMGIEWMTKDELTQAIPPAYTEYIGKYLMQAVLAQGYKLEDYE